MLKDISFGQYYPAKSFIHNLDPRVKLALSISYMAGVFFAQSFVAYGLVALYFILTVSFSSVPLRSIIKSVKPMLFLMVFVFLLNCLSFESSSEGGALLIRAWSLRVYELDLYGAVKMVFRLMILVMGMSIMTFTTTPMDLTSGLESLLKPLSLIGLPIREFALIMSIALRFVPILTEETDKIVKAQKARGADFESGRLLKRAKAYIPVLIPMFISAIMRADELAVAMDSRCYGYSKKPTKMKKLTLTWRDAVAFAVFVLFFGLVALMKYYPALFTAYPWISF